MKFKRELRRFFGTKAPAPILLAGTIYKNGAHTDKLD